MSTTAAPELNFEKIPPYQKRRFLPEAVDLGQIAELKKYYEKLQNQPVQSLEDLELWIHNRSELEAALDQYSSILYIRMSCQTDNKEYASAYQRFIEEVVPAVKPWEDALNRKFLEDVKKYPLDEARYGLYVKALKVDAEMFVKENIPLQTKVELLSQEYQTICGAMTVQWEGEEKTLAQVGKFLYDNDRGVRERAWRLMAERRLKDKDKLDVIFNDMLKLRHQISLNAKCKNHCEYKFKVLHRFDYTPADCKQFHESAESLIIPLWHQILENRREKMGLDKLRPWDTSVDPLGLSVLKPFEDIQELINKCQQIFYKIDPELGAQFEQVAGLGLLDLANRKGKAPGGYQAMLNECRKPFIFMNAVGLDSDVRTLLHEAGHAFHSLACSPDPLVHYRHGPMEFNEVASMAMEMLAGEFLDLFYNEDDFKRSYQTHLEDVVFTLVWVATIDCFQHWIYENPGHSLDERKEAWLSIRRRFGSEAVDWQGFDQEHAYLWHRQLHVFEYPFYYIEYAIAQLGALQLWINAKENWAKAVADYKKGLSYGGSKSLPELYAAAGIKFDFSAATIAPLMERVKKVMQF